MQITRPRFSIRPITEADLPAVLEVYRQCADFLALGPVPVASHDMVRADWDHSLAEGGQFCGIFDRGGPMIGVVDVIPRLHRGDPAGAFISLLMIARPYRSVGLGADVVCAIEAEIRRDPGVTVIRAGVQVNNPAAIRFWQRMGYRICGDADPQPDGTTAYPLQKDL